MKRDYKRKKLNNEKLNIATKSWFESEQKSYKIPNVEHLLPGKLPEVDNKLGLNWAKLSSYWNWALL